MTRRPLVVTAGYMPLDVIRTASRIQYAAGGTAANVAAILAFLGWRSVLAGQTGDDEAGLQLLNDLRAAGVDTEQIRQPIGMESPRLIHNVTTSGHNFSFSCPECRQKFPRSRPLTLEQAQRCAAEHPNPDVFFFDRTNAATLFLAERYARSGSLVMFEPSVPVNAELLHRAVRVAHIIKRSDERSVSGLDEIDVRPKDQLRIVTRGTEGLNFRIGSSRPRHLAALPTHVVDSGGAGDWTTAGLLSVVALDPRLSSRRVRAGLRFGQALAALSCTVPGARGLTRLTRRTVLSHTARVLKNGEVTSPPRFSAQESAEVAASDTCTTCLMPFPDAISTRRSVDALSRAR